MEVKVIHSLASNWENKLKIIEELEMSVQIFYLSILLTIKNYWICTSSKTNFWNIYIYN